MDKTYRIVREAARRVAEAASMTLDAFRDGRIEQEPAFTDRMLGHIEHTMQGFEAKGVRWGAKTLTDRGPMSQESVYGADFLGVLDIKLPGYSVSKGFLCQAKMVEIGAYISRSEYNRMRDQCEKMLSLTPASFVFIYSKVGIWVVPAISIIGSDCINPHNLYSRSVARFFEEHFSSFIGDRRIHVPHRITLAALAEEYHSRNALLLEARHWRSELTKAGDQRYIDF